LRRQGTGREGRFRRPGPIPPVSGIDEYMDYTQWVAEEIMPAVA